MPTARALRDGSWTAFMTFPPQVYGMLFEHFRHMAGVAPDQPDAEGTILVRLAEQDASIDLRVRRDDQGLDDLVLRQRAPSRGLGDALWKARLPLTRSPLRSPATGLPEPRHGEPAPAPRFWPATVAAAPSYKGPRRRAPARTRPVA